MITLSLLLSLVFPARWNARQQPIKTPTICMSEYQHRLAQCAIDNPDAQSLQRAVCDADARGQYTACIGGLP